MWALRASFSRNHSLPGKRDAEYRQWKKAVERTLGWV